MLCPPHSSRFDQPKKTTNKYTNFTGGGGACELINKPLDFSQTQLLY
jgi:hypothetical protein